MKWTTRSLLFSTLLIYTFTPTSPSTENETEEKCDIKLLLDPSDEATRNISSPGYPDQSYPPGVPYRWCLSTSDGIIISLHCEIFDIPKSANCETNALTVWLGEENKPRAHCGTTPFRVKSSSNNMNVSLHSSKKSRGGKFSCIVKAEEEETFSPRALVYENCDCGYSYRMRIVGGQETGINEFPLMAGLVDARRRGAVIVCGATIISPNYVLTADHCLDALVVDQTGIVVGEHNISTGSETTATSLIKAARFIPYPYYNSDTRRYDLALIQLASPITYSARVGPVCLPFGSRNWDLTREFVTVLGWGTTEFGGPRSRVLQKVDLQVVDIQRCIDTYGGDIDPYTQLCTFRDGKDACQEPQETKLTAISIVPNGDSTALPPGGIVCPKWRPHVKLKIVFCKASPEYDSGGPLLYYNPVISRWELVGVVSYGRGCASEAPGVNTYLAPFLQYILDNTQSETYCYKSN